MAEDEKNPKIDNRVQFRLTPDLHAWLIERGELRSSDFTPSALVLRELAMWREAQAMEQARIRWQLNELCLLADVLNGVLIDVSIGPLIFHEVSDAFDLYPSSYGNKWGVDENSMLAKVRQLSSTGDLATRHAIARWWSSHEQMDPRNPQTWIDLGFRLETENL